MNRSRAAIVLAVILLGSAAPLAAHPLGNFTINHLTRLALGARAIELHYVLDMAEIPTYQVLREVPGDGRPNDKQLAHWAQAEATALLPQLQLSVAGVRQRVRLEGVRASLRRGAGGLPTLYLVVNGHVGASAAAARSIAYRDGTFPERLGWHDIVVSPATEPTRELTDYTSVPLRSPRTTTAISIERQGENMVVRSEDDFQANDGRAPAISQLRTNQLSDMLVRGTDDWSFVLMTLLVAIALGALHALEPGHGKTLLAISLVGARASVNQAVILASGLTVAHTAGVIALGVAINLCKEYFVPEAIYPWITLCSGVVIAIVGARALQRQLRLNPGAVGHGHGHGHAHGHAHDIDDTAHAHAHAIPGNAPLTFGGTVWAAMSGGIAPCPAALVVLLAALALNEVVYGIFVIVAFSFGLGATLTGVGIAVVRGASWVQGRPGFAPLVQYGPAVSAVVISAIGALMVGQGFAARGMTTSPLAVTVVVALAIASYAMSHRFAHQHFGTA